MRVSTHWEKFVGDRGEFGIRLAFAPDPDHGAGATREESLTWGSFELWVEGNNLCAHLEQGEPVESVHWYMLPLIQWLTTNWESLFHEERHPEKDAGFGAWSSLQATRSAPPFLDEDRRERWEEEWQSWWNRHALQSCRNGGLFPDVLIRRWRDQIEVSWGPSPIAGAPDHFRFLSSCGFARLEPSKVAEPLYDVIKSATDYLVGRAPDSVLLGVTREQIKAIPDIAGARGRNSPDPHDGRSELEGP